MTKTKTGNRRWQYTLDLHQDVSHHFNHETVVVDLSYSNNGGHGMDIWKMQMNPESRFRSDGSWAHSIPLGSFYHVDSEELLKSGSDLYKSDCINDAEFMGSREEIISRAVKYHFDRIDFAESDEGKVLREEIKSF